MAGRKKFRDPRHGAVQPVASAVASVLEQRGLTRTIRGNRIAVEWEQLVGTRVATHCMPDGISRGALVIRVASSAWLHQLSMMRASLLASLLEALGPPPLFSELRLVLGNGALTGRATPTVVRTVAPPPAPAPLQHTAARQIIREVDQVDDAELRALIGAIRLKHAR
jgi:predicted nucleic acid-binding Zn ribbon protein